MADSVASNLPELTVSELAGAVKRTMEQTFDRVRVRGELGRVLVARSGHLYVDLKDENATISLVMWKTSAAKLAFKPEEGLEVVAEGRLTTYPSRSQYQLIADKLEPAGVGALLAQLEKLKAKLAGEGLFAAERKRAIPFLPGTIGVVTSPTGAVIRDILHRLEERFPRQVLLWPVLVQGEQAAGQIARAIIGFNEMTGALRPDVIIVARGGGSIEDLWAFNDEGVVRAAAASAIPLISAVGHETDTTLIDFAADKRAPTPTAAAEMAVPVRTELLERLSVDGARLIGALARTLERARADVRAAGARLGRPEMVLGLAQQRFDRAAERLAQGLTANAKAADSKFARIAARLRPNALNQDLGRRRIAVAERALRLARAEGTLVAANAQRLDSLGRLLETMSHQSVLQRGFALVIREGGKLARRAGDLSPGERVRLGFADGEALATIGEGEAPKGRRTRATPGAQGSLF